MVRTVAVDAACRDAEELARGAAVEISGSDEGVGDHLGVRAEAVRVVTHRFASLVPGYPGWEWSVVVMRAPRSRHVTVAEVGMQPGPDALTAPEWVPWRERVRPGDMSPGDLLPTAEDDERLVPGYALVEEGVSATDGDVGMAVEVGVGRHRVMSREGRTAAAHRWFGAHGPAARMAKSAPGRCATCGFYLSLGGWLGQAFGVCGNEYVATDGVVVSAEFGCGGHSEAAVGDDRTEDTSALVKDDWNLEVVKRPPQHPPGSVGDESPAEPLGHG